MAPAIPRLTVRDRPVLLVICGMVAVAVGCILPWAKLTAPFLGTLTKDGIEGDGQLFLAVAAAVAGLAWAYRSRTNRAVWIVMAGFIGLLGVGLLYEVVDLRDRFATAQLAGQDALGGGTISTSYGTGLWLVGLGVLLAAIGWSMLEKPRARRRRRRAPRRRIP